MFELTSILIPSVTVSEGIEIRHGCQFLSSLVRALAKLPGGLGRKNQWRFWGTLQGQLQSFWMALLGSVTVPLFFFHTFSPLVFTQGW